MTPPAWARRRAAAASCPAAAFALLTEARAAGLTAQMELAGRSLKGQLNTPTRSTRAMWRSSAPLRRCSKTCRRLPGDGGLRRGGACRLARTARCKRPAVTDHRSRAFLGRRSRRGISPGDAGRRSIRSWRVTATVAGPRSSGVGGPSRRAPFHSEAICADTGPRTMTQLIRPHQIALIMLALLVLVVRIARSQTQLRRRLGSSPAASGTPARPRPRPRPKPPRRPPASITARLPESADRPGRSTEPMAPPRSPSAKPTA